MANIPPEIWLHIANFIPTNQLRDLLEVNIVFFNLAMDIRYREVSITTSNLDQSMRTLKRLSDPFTASRVHLFKLSLELTDVKGFSNPIPTKLAGSRNQYQVQHSISRVFGGSKSPRPQPPLPAAVTKFTGLINEIIKTANKLINVRELYIGSWHLPLAYNPRPLFSSFWSSFGPKLYILSLSGNLEGCRTLIDSNPILDGLQELQIDADSDGPILVDILMPFINNLAPHLISLKLWLRASSFDFSAFFSRLAPFPGLTTLNVRTTSATLRGRALRGPIRDSSCTLQRVDLRLNSAGLTDGSLGRWFLEYISNGHLFSHLQVLDVSPTSLAAGMEFLLSCIQRTSQSLVELIVRERCMQGKEMEVVLDALSSCSNLTCLRINVWRLDVALIDRLALKLPRIDRLGLSIEKNDPNYSVDTFVKDLGKRSYTKWELKDIIIYQKGRKADNNIMLAISRSIPSLTSFFSNGHMQLC